MTTKLILSSVSGVLCICSLILNILFLIVLLRKVKQWKNTSANYLIISMTAADLLMTIFWAVPAVITAVFWDWLLGSGYCKFQDIVGTWCYVVVMNTMCVVAVEKLMLFCRPSKHKEVFYHTVVLVLIFGLWVFALVIALFPMMGWGEVWYSPYQIQCAEDYKSSYSLLSFKFVITFLIPLIAIVILYCITIHKVWRVRSRTTPGNGKLVLEEDQKIPHQSYGEKYAHQEKKFRKIRKKKKRENNEKVRKVKKDSKTANLVQSDKNNANPGVMQDDNNPHNNETNNTQNNEYDDDGYETISIESDTSDETPEDYATLNQRKQAQNRKRVYLFKEQEFRLALTMFFASLAYSACWLPLIVVSYFWAYKFDDPPSTDVVSAVTCLTFFGLFVKPIIYITDKWVRSWIVTAFRRKPKDDHRVKINKTPAEKTNKNKGNKEKKTNEIADSAIDVTEPSDVARV